MRNLFWNSENAHRIFLLCLFYLKTKKVYLGNRLFIFQYLACYHWYFLVCINVLLLLLNQKGDIQLTEDLINPTEMLLKKKKLKLSQENEITQFYVLKGDELDKDVFSWTLFLGKNASSFQNCRFYVCILFYNYIILPQCADHKLKQCNL